MRKRFCNTSDQVLLFVTDRTPRPTAVLRKVTNRLRSIRSAALFG